MSNYNSPLRNLKVATPCPADWNAMAGNDRVRYCGQCQLNVYNLSGMAQTEAERIVTQAEGRVCVRFYRRADGTVLTQDCPVGLRAVKQKVSRWATAVFASVLGFFSGVGLVAGWGEQREPERLMGAIAVQPEREPVIMGDIAPPVVMGDMVEVKGEVAIEEPIMGKMAAPKVRPKRR